jgi:hypothetical protein
LAVQFILRDVTNLTMEGIQHTVREAAAHPLQWLWLEQTLHNNGLSPCVVWQVLYPYADTAYPECSSATPQPATGQAFRTTSWAPPLATINAKEVPSCL